jgi:hypothetical protein
MVDTMQDNLDFHQELMDEAYGLWKREENRHWKQEDFLENLEPIPRAAVMLGNMNYQVENGGWGQWADNRYYLCADQLLSVLEEMVNFGYLLARPVTGMVSAIVESHEEAESLSPSDFWEDEGECGWCSGEYCECEGECECDDIGCDCVDSYDLWQEAVDECYLNVERNSERYYTINDDFMVQCEIYLRQKAGQDIPPEVLEAAERALSRVAEA